MRRKRRWRCLIGCSSSSFWIVLSSTANVKVLQNLDCPQGITPSSQANHRQIVALRLPGLSLSCSPGSWGAMMRDKSHRQTRTVCFSESWRNVFVYYWSRVNPDDVGASVCQRMFASRLISVVSLTTSCQPHHFLSTSNKQPHIFFHFGSWLFRGHMTLSSRQLTVTMMVVIW